MWHNHFATSNAKVRNIVWMADQNDIFRRHGLGSFPELLSLTIKHPAVLTWLDADENRAGNPNENLARELLELFTLGAGNFGEEDVKESARALTGWTVASEKFRHRKGWHDDGSKTVLGATGQFDGDDLLEIACNQPATSARLAWRLCNELLGESIVDETAIGELADGLRKNGQSIRCGVETILRSERFFSRKNLKSRIMDPEVFAIGAARAMELFAPPARTMVLGDWIEQMGRRLLFPPNVGGWPGGRDWLNTRTTIARSNFAAALVKGTLSPENEAPDLIDTARKHLGTADAKTCLEMFVKLLAGEDSPDQLKSLVSQVDAGNSQPNEWFPGAVATILNSASAQLC